MLYILVKSGYNKYLELMYKYIYIYNNPIFYLKNEYKQMWSNA